MQDSALDQHSGCRASRPVAFPCNRQAKKKYAFEIVETVQQALTFVDQERLGLLSPGEFVLDQTTFWQRSGTSGSRRGRAGEDTGGECWLMKTLSRGAGICCTR
jgi:hypothetical protein